MEVGKSKARLEVGGPANPLDTFFHRGLKPSEVKDLVTDVRCVPALTLEKGGMDVHTRADVATVQHGEEPLITVGNTDTLPACSYV